MVFITNNNVLCIALLVLLIMRHSSILIYEIAGIRDRYNSSQGGLLPLPPITEADGTMRKVDVPSKKSVGHIERIESV